MPKYFFNLEGGPDLAKDAYGDVHPSDKAAREAATHWCREIVAEGVRASWNMHGWVIVVSSSGGEIIARLPVQVTQH